MWQDYVLTSTNIVFSISLIPQVYDDFKSKAGSIALATSIPTFIGLYIVTFVFFTLDLYFSSLMSALTATLWLILSLQRILYKD